MFDAKLEEGTGRLCRTAADRVVDSTGDSVCHLGLTSLEVGSRGMNRIGQEVRALNCSLVFSTEMSDDVWSCPRQIELKSVGE